jgi:hypothetical protein
VGYARFPALLLSTTWRTTYLANEWVLTLQLYLPIRPSWVLSSQSTELAKSVVFDDDTDDRDGGGA